MRPRTLVSLVIFVSAYAPLSLLFAVRDYNDKIHWFQHPKFVFVALGTAVLSVVFLTLTMSIVRGQFLVTVKGVSQRSNDLVDYTIPYLISFFALDFGRWQDVVAFGIFMTLLFILSVKTQSIFLNPILAIWGYGLYEIDFEEGLRTKRGVFLAKIQLKPGIQYKMERLSRFLYLATSEFSAED